MTCRTKVAKIVRFGNPRWPPSWNSVLNFLSWTKRLIVLKLVGSIGVTVGKKKSLNHFDQKFKMTGILQIYFELLLNQTSNWLNMVWSIWMICKANVAKIIPMRNPRWLPTSWNSISNFITWTEMPTDSKFVWYLGKPSWPSWEAILTLLFQLQQACSYKDEHCCAHICFV